MESSSGSQEGKNSKTSDGSIQVNSTAQNFVHFTEEEEDLVFRMHRLVGNRWELIAGRIPGRTTEEIEKFWAIKHQDK
ncbi:MYB-like transcription factor ETC3 isoform X2 [Oryza brachyantha]|uniref:MYB-like transcription factor ETC3 isoform X2 n=1 Tax=Oryza brachyantha TaxID=4533 RepID=UPI0007767189|nr:MYB-like transcription factor ETC3 isoform X2 [Oryza brachyantha]